MRRKILALAFLLPLTCGADGFPYSTAIQMQEAAETLAKVRGVLSEFTMRHTEPGDTREFKVFLESPNGKTEIEVHKDGSFHLPTLPKEHWETSRLVHTLEKGAVTFDFGWGFIGEPPFEKIKEINLFKMCSELAGEFKKIEGQRSKLGAVVPLLTNSQVAIVGISFSREKPAGGKILLKRGASTVASIDLSQTGEASWTFDKYPPKEHTVVWEIKGDEPSPIAEMVFKTGEEAEKAKEAIFLWKVEPDGAANGSQPFGSE